MSKAILVKEESFYTFLEKNVLGYQKKEDNSMRVCGVGSISSHDIFNSEKRYFVYSLNGIEISDKINFEFSEFNYFLGTNVKYIATFEVEEYDSVLHRLILINKAIKK